jgi:type IV secretory pathway TrbL component
MFIWQEKRNTTREFHLTIKPLFIYHYDHFFRSLRGKVFLTLFCLLSPVFSCIRRRSKTMKKRMTVKMNILLVIFALVLVPVCASAQTQTPAGGAGAAGAAAQGTTATAAGAGAAGAGGAEGLSTAAIVGIAAGVAAIAVIAIAAGGGDGGETTPGHTAGH